MLLIAGHIGHNYVGHNYIGVRVGVADRGSCYDARVEAKQAGGGQQCTDMCRDMHVDMRIDMCIDICVPTCVWAYPWACV